MLVILFFTL